MPPKSERKGNNRKLTTQQSVNGAVKSICDIMRRSNCAGALQYVPELTWILFLRILDEREEREAEEADAVGAEFTPSLTEPYRWQDWAAPEGEKRQELQDGALGAFFGFVNGDLLPHLKGLREQPGATARQKVISEIMSGWSECGSTRNATSSTSSTRYMTSAPRVLIRRTCSPCHRCTRASC